MQFLWFSYYKTANHTTPCSVVRCNITCSAVRLCHFADGFDAVFVVYAIYTVRWTPLAIILFVECGGIFIRSISFWSHGGLLAAQRWRGQKMTTNQLIAFILPFHEELRTPKAKNRDSKIFIHVLIWYLWKGHSSKTYPQWLEFQYYSTKHRNFFWNWSCNISGLYQSFPCFL